MENYLIQEGYDILECPRCDKPCKPDAKRMNGTIVYERHKCKSEYQREVIMYHFEIDEHGDFID